GHTSFSRDWSSDVCSSDLPPRAYSLTSTPDEPYLAITIKEEAFVPGQTEYPPLLSPFLVFGTRVGMKITVKGYTGYYVLPDDVEDRKSVVQGKSVYAGRSR